MRSWCPSVYLSVHLGIRPLTSQWALFHSILFRNRLHVPACTHIGASVTLCNPVPSGIPVSHHYPLLTTFGILPRFKMLSQWAVSPSCHEGRQRHTRPSFPSQDCMGGGAGKAVKWEPSSHGIPGKALPAIPLFKTIPPSHAPSFGSNWRLPVPTTSSDIWQYLETHSIIITWAVVGGDTPGI